MKKDNEQLLSALQAEEEAAAEYTHGQLREQRTDAYNEYLRLPYGNETVGRSTVISSDVMDAIEGMMPDILDIFVTSDKAVQFDPHGEEDVESAKQVTEACNYVFYKQNNGFLILYTAIKDALMLKTGGVKWCWEEKRTVSFTTYKDVTEEQITQFLAENDTAEVMEKEEKQTQSIDPYSGLPVSMMVYDVKVKTVETKGMERIYNIPPEELLVSRKHSSILLDDCPYVAHVSLRSLTDMIQMGLDVTIEDVKAAKDDYAQEFDREIDNDFMPDHAMSNRDDDAMQEGYLKEEYILFDLDGDGIAERLKVFRLGNKIIEVKEVSHVPIAAWTPTILTHQFYGLSIHDFVTDIQKIKSEIWRQTLDNLSFTNNQRTRVLTDPVTQAPMANIDDILNPIPGGVIREYTSGAVQPYDHQWIGSQTIPMFEFLDQNKENRTGFTRYSQGLDSNALNQTARGVSLIMNASQKRMKLMSRICAECLVAPMFKGIFKDLTDYCMDKLSFRLSGKFVQYDPQEWRDGYDLSINVGLGTGDKEQNMLAFQQIAMVQEKLRAAGLSQLVTDENIYKLASRMTENAGFKEVNEFFTEPQQGQPNVMQLQQQLQQMQQQMQEGMQEFQRVKQENMTLKADAEVDKVEIAKTKAAGFIKDLTQKHVDTVNTPPPDNVIQFRQDEALERRLMEMQEQINAPKVKRTSLMHVGEGRYLAETIEVRQTDELTENE